MGANTKKRGSIDIWAGYQPFPSQAAFHKATRDPKVQFLLLAGGFGGGKTMPSCRQTFQWSLEYPGSFGVIAGRSYTHLIRSTWRTYQRELRATGLIDWVEVTGGSSTTPPKVEFAPELGGSIVQFINLKEEEDLYGVEPDWFFVDEAGQVADNLLQTLAGRMRGTPSPTGKIVNAAGYRVIGPLKGVYATNPGPSKFLRRNFRPPGVPGEPTSERFACFAVPTLENPTLADSYLEFLRNEYTGARYKAFVEGDWSAFEGQLFTMWDPDRHITPPCTMRDLGPDWAVVEGWDFGRAVETAVVWIAYHRYGKHPKRVIGEYGAAEKEVSEHAAAVKAKREQLGIREVIVVGDPAGNQRGAAGSYINEYAREGIYIAPCMAGRSLPVRDARLANELHHTMPDGRPGLTINADCTEVIDAIIQARYRTDHDDDPDKERPEQRVKKDDHRLDALEYGVMLTPLPATMGNGTPWPDGLRSGEVGIDSHTAFRAWFEQLDQRPRR